MKRFLLAAVVASLSLALTDSIQAQPKSERAKIPSSLSNVRSKFNALKLTPNLIVGQFSATRFANQTAVSLRVYNEGPVSYSGGRSYVIEEFLPGGGARVLQSGPIPALSVDGSKSFIVYVPYDNRAHTYFVRLVPGDRSPNDDVQSCSIQPNAPDHTKHPRER